MARNCNCAGSTCGCAMTGGNGISVSGIGTAANPFVISAEGQPVTGLLQVDDTTTVNLTLNGAGSITDPYVLSAEVRSEIRKGVGSPNGVVAAPVGTMYTRSDGGTSSTLYVKESGTGDTGWVAK